MSNVVYTPDLNGPFSYLSCLKDGQGLPQSSTWITTAAVAAVAALGYGINKAIPWVKTQVEDCPMLDYCLYGCGAVFNSLFKSGRNTHQFEAAISILNRMNPNFVKDNFDALIANKEHAWGIASGFEQLCLVAPALGTQANLRKLIERGGERAREICSGFYQVCLADPNLGTQSNLDRLIDSREDAEDIGILFRSLPAVLRTQPNFDTLMKYAKYSQAIGLCFARLPIHLQNQNSLSSLITKYLTRHHPF